MTHRTMSERSYHGATSRSQEQELVGRYYDNWLEQEIDHWVSLGAINLTTYHIH